MGVDDKFENKAEDLGGRAKETIGDVTGDDQLKAEGATDQLKAKAKEGLLKVWLTSRLDKFQEG
ncbi:uncharacterized protein YjbJ (UPF0337 family) [Brevibacterium epidermidis]|uniref:Uncharacterized protein YjbJ (UPF0337 family) n=1 Tax=Brevibacterium epidermidis TaxID=1698 RepID=A0ABV4EPG5_BREEP